MLAGNRIVGITGLALALALGACSSSGEQSSPSGSDISRVGVSGAAGGPGTIAGGSTMPPIATLPSVPAAASSALELPGLDEVEIGCVSSAVSGEAIKTPSLADNDDALAAVVGTALGTCVPTPKLANAIVQDLHGQLQGAALTSDQLTCIRSRIATNDPRPMAVFLGGVAMAKPDTIKAGAIPIDQACGTTLAKG